MYVIVMVLSSFGIGAQVLITILILSDYNLMSHCASIGFPDCTHAEPIDWLVQELNGAHFRLTIVVVSYNQNTISMHLTE